MSRCRSVGVLVALIAVAGLVVPAAAQADTLSAPQVYVRLVDPDNLTVGIGPWAPLSASLGSMGPYDIGVKLQQTSDPENRQSFDVALTADPGGAPPTDWKLREPYSESCHGGSGAAGTIKDTSAILYYHGNGAYKLSVSIYTFAQWQMQSGGFGPCSGGPTSSVTLNATATPTVKIEGTPLVPSVTPMGKGFNGLRIGLPSFNQGDRWRCARNPVLHAGGPVTGTNTTGDSSTGAGSTFDQADEADAFKAGPGRWACSAQALSGDNDANEFGTPWVSTPVVTVKGEYARANSRLAFARHHRMRLTVLTPRVMVPAATGGRLTLTISGATCKSARKGIVKLHPVLTTRARVDTNGRAVFSFHSPSQDGFYLGRLTFGGTSLIVPGTDAPMYLAVIAPRHAVQFVNPASWSVCG